MKRALVTMEELKNYMDGHGDPECECLHMRFCKTIDAMLPFLEHRAKGFGLETDSTWEKTSPDKAKKLLKQMGAL